jgi:Right handed beta helix region
MKKFYIPFYLKILILQIILLSNTILPDVRFVSKTGSAKPPYISWETAADSIQKCINVSHSGDTIYVANGTYTEKITTIPGLTLIGGGQDSCIIDDRAISFDVFHAIDVTDSCSIEGFKVIVSDQMLGFGFYCKGKNIVIKNNNLCKAYQGVFIDSSQTEIFNNNISYCNGIYSTESRSRIHDNLSTNSGNGEFINFVNMFWGYENYVYNNLIYAGSGSAIYVLVGTKLIATNNIIILNDQYAAAFVGVEPDTVRFYNNLVFSSNSDGMCTLAGRPNYIYNNVFYGPGSYGSLYLNNGTHFIVNNVFMNATIGIWRANNASASIQYNDFFNNATNFNGITADSTNLSLDPMFVNPDSLDFHFQMFSPLIDGGDPSILDPDSTRSDIGLYGGMLYGQSYKYMDYPPKPPKGLTAVKDSSKIKLSWKNNTEADFNHYLLYRDTTAGFIADSTKLVSQLTVNVYNQIIPNNVNRLYYKLKAVDNQGKVSGLSDEVGVVITGINGNENNIIQDYRLYQNYPNPFNPSTIISYRLKEEGHVKLTVYDIKGATVANLVNRSQSAGYYEVQFTGNNKNKGEGFVDRFASGIYIYRLEVTSRNNIPLFTDIKKMILLK